LRHTEGEKKPGFEPSWIEARQTVSRRITERCILQHSRNNIAVHLPFARTANDQT